MYLGILRTLMLSDFTSCVHNCGQDVTRGWGGCILHHQIANVFRYKSESKSRFYGQLRVN